MEKKNEDINNNKFFQITNNDNDSREFTLMIIPGNGCGPQIKDSNWYEWLYIKLIDKYPKAKIICENFPDWKVAREKNWVPFIKENFDKNKNEKNYVVGHSSGAVCIFRLLETFKVTGAFILSGCLDHLGDQNELNSGYYPQQPDSDVQRPWRWDLMLKNSDWLVKLGSEDDCFIGVEHFRKIKENLNLIDNESYFEFKKEENMSHFMFDSFPFLFDLIVNKIEADFNK